MYVLVQYVTSAKLPRSEDVSSPYSVMPSREENWTVESIWESSTFEIETNIEPQPRAKEKALPPEASLPKGKNEKDESKNALGEKKSEQQRQTEATVDEKSKKESQGKVVGSNKEPATSFTNKVPRSTTVRLAARLFTAESGRTTGRVRTIGYPRF